MQEEPPTLQSRESSIPIAGVICTNTQNETKDKKIEDFINHVMVRMIQFIPVIVVHLNWLFSFPSSSAKHVCDLYSNHIISLYNIFRFAKMGRRLSALVKLQK